MNDNPIKICINIEASITISLFYTQQIWVIKMYSKKLPIKTIIICVCLTILSSAPLPIFAAQVKPVSKTKKDGYARLYIYRPSAFWGSLVTAPIYINHHFAARIGNGGEIIKIVPAGLVSVSTSAGTVGVVLKNEGATHLRFQAIKGKTYRIKVTNPYQIELAGPIMGESAFQLQLMK